MPRKSFSREDPQTRRQHLIDATLAVIGRDGFSGATVRAISVEADVTQGLIRHYFESKEDLVSAAYEYHMTRMTERSLSPLDDPEASARAQLRHVVLNSVSAEVMSLANLTLWASFIAQVHTEEAIRRTHQRTYLPFRDAFAGLIGAASAEAGHPLSAAEVRAKAVMCCAVLDGLWIEGAALPEEYERAEIEDLALGAVRALVGPALEPDP
ncbi:MAG: TetR family transcriptional regulator C-terminal domain-containing protein [Pseudomonadota bacterium]